MNTVHKQIINEIADGDERAFAEFCFHYKDKISPLLLPENRFDAHGIIQDTFLLRGKPA